MKTRTLLTVTLIAGAILLVTGTSIAGIVRTALADANQLAPGQGFGGEHRNPSGDNPPPGQSDKISNSGQCLKAGVDHDACFPK